MIITDKAQIKIAELIESDLKLPADATFTRSSVAYLSDGTQVDVNTPRFEPGKFGKAILIEEGTTNLLGTLSPKSGAKVTTEITHYTNQPVFYCDGSADWQGIMASQRVTLTAGTEYTFSVYVYNPSTDEGALNIQVDSDEISNESIGTVVVPPGPGWHRIVRKWSPPANRHVSTIRFENRMRTDWKSGSNQCYMTAPQVEAKPYVTSFIDGTRSPESLTIPTAGVLNPQEGTVEFWWNPLAKTPQTFPSLIATGQWTSPITQDWLAIYWGSGWSNANTVAFAMNNKNGTINFDMSVTLNPQPYTWYYVAAKWSFVTRIAKLIIHRPDGTYVSTQATINGEPPTFEGWDKFYILQTWNSGDSKANSLIDDLRISSIARSDEEILQAYLSNKPLSIDEHTTYKLDFNSKVTLEESGELLCDEIIETDLSLEGATFVRNSVAYKSDGTLVQVNEPRLEPGKFGKAILIEEGTTNLLPANKANCEVAPDVTEYATVTADTSRKLVGSGSLKVQWDGSGSYAFAQYNITLTNGNTYTVSGWVYAEESKYLRLSVQESASPWRVFNTGLVLIPAKQWTRLSVTFTLPSDWTQPSRIQLNPPRNSTTLSDFATIPAWWDAIQVERKPYATSFINGTRAAETLTIPTTGVLNPQEGTVECWVYFDANSLASNRGNFWIIGTAKTNYADIIILQRLGSNLTFQVSNGTTTTAISFPLSNINIGWHYLAARWSTSEVSLFLDGTKIATASNPNLPQSLAANCGIGYNIVSGTEQCNTLIDDLRISNRARTDAEILAAYQSGKPLLADEWTTYKLDFDDKVRITAQGQIICNEFIEI